MDQELNGKEVKGTSFLGEAIFHLRRVGKNENQNRVSISSRGGITIVVLDYNKAPSCLKQKGEENRKEPFLGVGYSKCSLLDNYNKKLGRLIARGRAGAVIRRVGWATPKVNFGKKVFANEIHEEVLLEIIKSALFEAKIGYAVVMGSRIFQLGSKVSKSNKFPPTLGEATLNWIYYGDNSVTKGEV